MKLALTLSFALAALFWADPDQQPACRQACAQRYEADLVACREQTRKPTDVCQDEAQDRHQECIDRCND